VNGGCESSWLTSPRRRVCPVRPLVCDAMFNRHA
jgi:hypothetical protein